RRRAVGEPRRRAPPGGRGLRAGAHPPAARARRPAPPAGGRGPDRRPEEGRQEEAIVKPRVKRAAPRAKDVEVQVGSRRLVLKNLDKVFYPKAGFTKGDVIDYYARIAAVLLPHLRDRALT